MKRAAELALSVSLVVLATFGGVIEPASAQLNWSQTFGQLPQMGDVDARQTQMLQNINDALAQGRLTGQQAASFKAELDRIKQSETQYRADGKLSIWEKVRLAFELDNLQKQIDAGLAPRTSAISDIPAREADITREISDALFAGRLTKPDADIYLAEINRIKAQEAAYRAGGTLNESAMLALSLDLDKLQKNIHDNMNPVAVNDPGIQSKKAEIDKRIKDLLAQGKITPAEANSYAQQLAKIQAEQDAFIASYGKLDTSESLTLAIDLERLSASLDRYQPAYTANAPGIDQRKQEVEKLLSEAMNSGKLNSQQVLDLKQEFDRIAAQEASYRSDGNLSDVETLTLAQELDGLKTKIQTFSGASAPQGIDERIAAVKKRLSELESTGRVSPQNAQDLHNQLSSIESRRNYFNQDGRLDDSEILTLASDIDQFKINLDKSAIPLPDINRKRLDLEQRINESLGSGRLKADDGAALKADLVRIKGLESTLKNSEGGLSEQAINALNQEYDAEAQRLNKLMPALPDLAAKESSIQSRISEAARQGAISEDDRRNFMSEYDRIKGVEATFRSSESALTDWEVMSVARDLDRLDSDLSRVLSTPPKIDTSGAAPDIQGHWAEQYIAVLSKRGTIGGFPDGTFKPNDFITRAQFAAIATRALNLPAAGRPTNFKDVPAKYWGANAIGQVSDAGLVTGFPDGSFRPEDKITRAQALVILAKALQNPNTDSAAMNRFKDSNTVPTWALPSIAKAANANIIVSYPDPESIKPNELATRADVAALTYQTMANLGEKLPQIRVGLEASGK